MGYTDTSKIKISLIDKNTAKELIIKNHYTHSWSSCRYAFGIYYQTDKSLFFDDYNYELIGAVIYGFPVGRQVVKSISEILENDNVLELTRLFIYDGYGTNIESFSIAQTFKLIKNLDKNIKVIISYSDPEQGHLGIIYQAVNGIYQGDKIRIVDSYWYKFPDEKTWMHPRTVVSKYKSLSEKDLLKIYPSGYQIKELKRKHRYIWVFGNKLEKRKILSTLKYPSLPYPKKDDEYIENIIEILPEDLKRNKK